MTNRSMDFILSNTRPSAKYFLLAFHWTYLWQGSANGASSGPKKSKFQSGHRVVKWFFWWNAPYPVSAHGILTHPGFRKCIRFGWQSLCSGVLAAEIRHVTKNQRYQNTRTLCQFSSERSAINKTWTQIFGDPLCAFSDPSYSFLNHGSEVAPLAETLSYAIYAISIFGFLRQKLVGKK